MSDTDDELIENGYIFIATSDTYKKYDLYYVSATTNLETRLADYNKDRRDDKMYYISTNKSKKTKTLIGAIKRILERIKYNDTDNLYKSDIIKLRPFIEGITYAINKDPSLLSETYRPGMEDIKSCGDRVFSMLM